MTTILNERYGLTPGGIAKYAMNRILRIYPTYLIVFFIAISAMFLLGTENISAFDVNLDIPSDIRLWAKNITLIGMDFFVQQRSVPPAWTLFIELSYYIFIPFVLISGRRAVWIWFLASVTWHGYIIAVSHQPYFDWNARYGSVLAGSLGFSVGCLLSLYQRKIRIPVTLGAFAILLLALLHGAGMISYLFRLNDVFAVPLSVYFYYLNMLLSAVIVIFLFKIKEGKFSKAIGNYSYPLYLVHLPCGFIVYKLSGMVVHSWSLFLSSMMLSLLVCYLLVQLEERINKIRRKIKAV